MCENDGIFGKQVVAFSNVTSGNFLLVDRDLNTVIELCKPITNPGSGQTAMKTVFL